MKNLKYLLVCSVFILIAIGSGSEGDSSLATATVSYMDSADVTQKDFFGIIAEYDSIFDTSIEGNEIQFQEICNSKNESIKEFFKRNNLKNLTVQNWFGEVTEIQSFYNGGGLEVKCSSTGESNSGSTFYLNTSNILDDLLILDQTRIKKDSELYKTLAKLKVGSIIRFSGKFVKPYYAPSNIGTNSKYADVDQEYIFKFTSVEDISPNL